MKPSCTCELPCGCQIEPDHLLTPGPAPSDRRYFDRRQDPETRKLIAAALRAELEYLDSGAYGQFARSPELPSPAFKMAPICPHRGTASSECCECVLWSFVPPERRHENIPCHHIPMDERGTTIDAISSGPQREVEDLERAWLQKMIRQFEQTS